MKGKVEKITSYKKNQLGEYYTPNSLAQYIVNSTFKLFSRYNPSKILPNVKILDLGVGNGVFFLAAANYIEKNVVNKASADPIQLRNKIIKENLYGVDYNSEVIESCRSKVNSWIIGTNGELLSSKQKQIIKKTLENKIRAGNILLGDVFSNVSLHKDSMDYETKKEPFHWYKQFPEIFNSNKAGFDLILCNPPYVTKDLPLEDIRLYRQLYKDKIVMNRFNLYHLFFARIVDLLNAEGIVSFLTANSILTDRFSSKLREFLVTNFRITSLIDFVSRTKIFPNILQGTCVLILRKEGKNKQYNTHVIRTFDHFSLDRGEIESNLIPITDLIQFSKIIPSPFHSTFQILRILRKNSDQLKNAVKIQSGEIRPADKNIRPFYYKQLPSNLSSSRFDVVLNGKNVSPFYINLSSKRKKARWYLKPKDSNFEVYRKDHTLTPRIVFQRITAREQLRRVVAGIITEEDLDEYNQIWVENNLNYFLLDTINQYYQQEVLLGIFNSLLINWYLHQINLTAAIPPADLGLIPIPKYSTKIEDDLIILGEKVLELRKIVKKIVNSSKILEVLCPVCSPNNEISKLRSDIDSLIFRIYDLPKNCQKEILRQLFLHHSYFNHH